MATKTLSIQEIADDTQLWEAYGAALHIDRYPEGCRTAGHHCEICLAMLGQEPHVMLSRVVGARRGYRGHVEYRCTVQGCTTWNDR